MLASFRQVAETLATKKRKEIEKEQVRRKSLWQGDVSWSWILCFKCRIEFDHLLIYLIQMAVPLDSSAPALPSSFSNLSISSLPGSRTSVLDLGRRSTSTDAPGADMKWVDDFGDELAVAIALQDWEEAVRLVEKGLSSSVNMPVSLVPRSTLSLDSRPGPPLHLFLIRRSGTFVDPPSKVSTASKRIVHFVDARARPAEPPEIHPGHSGLVLLSTRPTGASSLDVLVRQDGSHQAADRTDQMGGR